MIEEIAVPADALDRLAEINDDVLTHLAKAQEFHVAIASWITEDTDLWDEEGVLTPDGLMELRCYLESAFGVFQSYATRVDGQYWMSAEEETYSEFLPMRLLSAALGE